MEEKKFPGIQLVVAKKFPGGAVDLICTGACNGREDGTRVVSIFGAVGVGDELKLLEERQEKDNLTRY